MTDIWSPVGKRLYQAVAVLFNQQNKNSALFLDPGLGKTSISLASMKLILENRKNRGVLLIAPIRTTYLVWPKEKAKWKNFRHLSMVSLAGNIPHEQRLNHLWGVQKHIYIINPESMPWLQRELLVGLTQGKKCPFNVLFIDESTRYGAPTASTRFKLLKDFLPLFREKHIMTGTPVHRGLLKLWSQIYILDGGMCLGKNFYKYREKYFYKVGEYGWVPHSWAKDEIFQKLKDAKLALVMSEKDHLKLPGKVDNDISVSLPEKVMKAYRKLEDDLHVMLDSGVSITANSNVHARMKCVQFANGRIYEDIPEDMDKLQRKEFLKTRKIFHIHSAKVEALKELISELNGKPLLVAYYFRHDLDALLETFGADTPNIGSDSTAADDIWIEKEWNSGKIPLLLANPSSAALGLNLQECGNDICWYSMIDDPENYDQFNRRLYRSGVKGVVRIHHLLCENTIDEVMVGKLRKKYTNHEDFISALKLHRADMD